MTAPQFPTLHETPTIVPPGERNTLTAIFSQEKSLQPAAQSTDIAPTLGKSSSLFNYLKLGMVYSILFFAPIAGAYGLNSALAGSDTTALVSAASPESPIPQDYQSAVPASVSSNTSATNDVDYELSLANGFLQKAVKISNASAVQTVEEKNTVIQLLNQALEAANRAIQVAPSDHRGYTSRGRVYLATSAIKPEMRALADQDFAKATELGATDPSGIPNTGNPIDYLPTEQAANGQQATIAAPESGTTGTVSGQEGANAKRGTVTLAGGQLETFVNYTQVKSDTQLYVVADNNPENLTFYVKNKEEGVGFTIATTTAPSSPVEITWWEIE